MQQDRYLHRTTYTSHYLYIALLIHRTTYASYYLYIALYTAHNVRIATMYASHYTIHRTVLMQVPLKNEHVTVYIPHLPNPRLLSCFSIFVPCCVLPRCLCALCRLPPVLQHRHRHARHRRSPPRDRECTAISANKGAVSVRERAVNEAALRVSLVCLMVCLCVVVFSWCSAPASPAASFVAALVLCSHMRTCRVSGVCVAGRADATSALDAGLGSGLPGTSNF